MRLFPFCFTLTRAGVDEACRWRRRLWLELRWALRLGLGILGLLGMRGMGLLGHLRCLRLVLVGILGLVCVRLVLRRMRLVL